MSTAKTTTIQIEIPSPPDTHFLLPQEWKGKVKFQDNDMVYSHSDSEWYSLTSDDIWQDSLAVARLRPRNPKGLPDDVFRKLPMDARALSDAELKRLEEMGGLRELDEKLIYWNGNAVGWDAGNTGINTTFNVYATLHPANYYMELPDSAFAWGKKEEEGFVNLEAAIKEIPTDCELITDPNDTCRIGDWVWMGYWKVATGCVGVKIGNIGNSFVARPIAKPVFHDESFNNTYNKPKAEEEEEPEEQHPEEDTTQDRPHTFGSCPRHGFVRMKGCREVRPFCITEKGITPFQRAFRDWVRAMDTLDYSADGHKWGKFAQKGAK